MCSSEPYLHSGGPFLQKFFFAKQRSIVGMWELECLVRVLPVNVQRSLYINEGIYNDTSKNNSGVRCVLIFEPTCAYARWTHMHHFASGCDWTKSHLSKSHISGFV